jgi:sugar O-acyltransferase (sialic acid O-acetyltransferase NeuD family)
MWAYKREKSSLFATSFGNQCDEEDNFFMNAGQNQVSKGIKVVIFGLEQLSSLAWYVLIQDSPYEVAGFTVDAAWCRTSSLHDLPIVPFDLLERCFPPDEYALLIPLGWTNCNGLRAAKYAEGKARGYAFATYVSSRAIVWLDLQIGENSMIYEGAIVQPFARVGNNCILRSGCHVSHNAVLADHVFMSAHAVVAGNAKIGERCFLGLNSTIRDGITVAPRCFVAAGAVVTADTEPDGLYVGVPARRRPVPENL